MKKPSELTKESLIAGLNVHIRDNSADAFIKLWQAGKARAVELIHQNWCDEASELMRAYSGLLETLRPMNPDFLLEILSVLPDNHIATLRLLDINEEIDQAIITGKVDTQSLTPLPIGGSDRLILWAIKHRNLPYLEEVVSNVCRSLRDRFAGNQEIMGAVSDLFIETLAYRQKPPFLTSPLIDEEISSIVTAYTGKHKGEMVGLLVKMAMPKTMMAMLEQGRIGRYQQACNRNFSQVLACIPKVMTPLQLNAVLHFLEPKGLAEEILFNKNIDLDKFIQSMRETKFVITYGTDFGIVTMHPFFEHFTPSNFSDPHKKARILKLLDAGCEEEVRKSTKTAEELRRLLIKFKVPEFLFKHLNRLKGIELEDAMGL
jgi:hypothetical protein